MKNISVIFFGTHNFAAAILAGLIKSSFISIDLVITQPDRPIGRNQKLQPSQVKILAEKCGLKIDQPKSLKNYGLRITDYGLQLGIVAQYGLLIPDRLINAPEHGTLNVHTSLLPKYRGASPIQCALSNGESVTGVTIMKLDEGLDTGPILRQKSLKIDPDDIYPILEEKLAKIGLQALLAAIPPYLQGKLPLKPQAEAQASQCSQLSREDGKIDWSKSARAVYNLYRGLTPWPGIWTIWNNRRLKLLKIRPVTGQPANKKPGLARVEDNKIFIDCGKDAIEILELQLEGKKSLEAKKFLNGHQNINGDVLI